MIAREPARDVAWRGAHERRVERDALLLMQRTMLGVVRPRDAAEAHLLRVRGLARMDDRIGRRPIGIGDGTLRVVCLFLVAYYVKLADCKVSISIF